MQHFKVKLYATGETASTAPVHDVIPVFHRWIQDNAIPETLIDVSDYIHVPEGPGIILVAHEGIYSLDTEHGRLGLTYTRRAALDGTDAARLRQAIAAVLHAARLLETAPEFAGKLAFDRDRWEVSVNDRLLAPNTPESYAILEALVAAELPPAAGAGNWAISHSGEPRELLRASARRTA
ncbi:MAG: hypothetical protein IT163_11140 [Bryobacterales bacterium]|nr:hypothetical protein [Bryobacterales bacterium]